jgi:hypothetical protein
VTRNSDAVMESRKARVGQVAEIAEMPFALFPSVASRQKSMHSLHCESTGERLM